MCNLFQVSIVWQSKGSWSTLGWYRGLRTPLTWTPSAKGPFLCADRPCFITLPRTKIWSGGVPRCSIGFWRAKSSLVISRYCLSRMERKLTSYWKVENQQAKCWWKHNRRNSHVQVVRYLSFVDTRVFFPLAMFGSGWKFTVCNFSREISSFSTGSAGVVCDKKIKNIYR